jgi:structural maintenance of chromosome 3 (chondroitin sulfate proteoglycan 6)
MTSTLENVDGRLRDLEEEMTELREFQEKERERKALEYAMYEGELEEITGTLGE